MRATGASEGVLGLDAIEDEAEGVALSDRGANDGVRILDMVLLTFPKLHRHHTWLRISVCSLGSIRLWNRYHVVFPFLDNFLGSSGDGNILMRS